MNMKNLLSLFIVSVLFFWSIFSTVASEQLPANIRALNTYLWSIGTNERVEVYGEIIDNIDALIKGVNTSKKLSKLQKKLLAQYRLYKFRTQIALNREQKRISANIDFQKIIPKKNTSTWTVVVSTWTIDGHQSTQNIQSPPYSYTPTTSTPSSTGNTISAQSGTTVWGSATIITTPKNTTITFSSSWPNNLIIAWKSSAQLGGFSIQTWDDELMIRKLVFRNIWTARLRDLIINDVKLWNLDQQSEVSNTTIIQDNTINIVNMALAIQKNRKLSYTMHSAIGAILWSFWNTVQLRFAPEESEIYTYSNASGMILLGSGNLINSLSFPIVWVYWSAPYVNMNRKSPTTALISFENWSEEFDIQIESFKLDILSSQYWSKLNGTVCFREEQSSVSCKDSWAFMPRVIEDNSSTYYLQVTPATFSSSNTASKRYGNWNKASYELFLDWIYLDEAPRVIVSEIVYKAWWYTFKVIANSAGNLENPIMQN